MLFSLEGQIKFKGKNFVVLENNGISWQIFVSDLFLEKIEVGQNLKIYTFLVLKEEGIELYGFKNLEEREFFQELNAVPQIGPKTALGVLSLAKISDLKEAITSGDIGFLTKVSGIGQKTSQRIVLEMKEKLGKLVFKERRGDEEVIDALISLGWKLNEARQVIRKIPSEIRGTRERLKSALKILGGNR